MFRRCMWRNGSRRRCGGWPRRRSSYARPGALISSNAWPAATPGDRQTPRLWTRSSAKLPRVRRREPLNKRALAKLPPSANANFQSVDLDQCRIVDMALNLFSLRAVKTAAATRPFIEQYHTFSLDGVISSAVAWRIQKRVPLRAGRTAGGCLAFRPVTKNIASPMIGPSSFPGNAYNGKIASIIIGVRINDLCKAIHILRCALSR